MSQKRSTLAGRLLYRGWHAPLATFRTGNREGWINFSSSRLGRAAMDRAVSNLPILKLPTEQSPHVWFLSGKRFWQQTLFCASSLQDAIAAPIRCTIVDDGTLRQSEYEFLQRWMPGSTIVDQDCIAEALDRDLPESRFPALRRRRLVYPHLRKLTDVHTQGRGWKLVLDSDMLFYSRPETILHWLERPTAPLHMQDVETAYGYSDGLLKELAGGAVPPRVNVGVCGLQSESIDWERVESWCRTMIEREGEHYLQEQALTALLVRESATVLPVSEGIVCPSRDETLRPTVSLHHYVAESKAWYFRFAWRRILDMRQGAST